MGTPERNHFAAVARPARLAVAGLAAFVALLIGAADAGATTFCVPGFFAGCPDNGTNVAESDLESALNSDAADAAADQILIAPGTTTDTNTITLSTGSDDLLIRGSGPDQTFLTSTTTANAKVVNLAGGDNTRDVTVQDLTIQIPATMPDGSGAGTQVSADALENVDIVSLNPSSDGAASWLGGGSFAGGTIRGEGSGSILTGVAHGHNGTVTVTNARIEGAIGVGNTDPDGELVVSNSSIIDTGVGAQADAGTITLSDTQITAATFALFATAGAFDAFIDADHVTIVGTQPSAIGVVSEADPGSAGNAKVTIRNSILQGPKAFKCGSLGTGSAEFLAYYSNLDGTTGETNAGCSTLSANSINADPGFRSATDLRLTAGSPSIDSGDPTAIYPGFDLDLSGLPRVTDGDGDDVAKTDQGAFEFDAIAPKTKLESGPGKGTRKGRARFTFSSNEAGATFMCRIDAKKPVACTSPKSYKNLKPGRHTFKVFAVDSYGNKDASPAARSFRVPG